AERILVGHPAHIDAAARGELDVPPRARVDLEDAELAVARIALEFGAENAAVLQSFQQLDQPIACFRDLVHRYADAIRAVAEMRRIYAHPPAREKARQRAVAIAKAVDEIVIRRPAGDVLLRDHVQSLRFQFFPSPLERGPVAHPEAL